MRWFRRTEKAVADWPKMTIMQRQGGVRLHGKYAWPGMDSWGNLMFGALVILAMYYAWVEGGGGRGALSVAAGMIVPWLFLRRTILLSTLGRTLDVQIPPDIIRVKRKRYDRSAVRGFRMERHHKATEEARLEQRRGKRMDPVYREALEVVMDYGEKRIPIAAMPDRDERKAEALMYRLQNAVENLELIVSGEEAVGGAGPGPSDTFGKPPDIR